MDLELLTQSVEIIPHKVTTWREQWSTIFGAAYSIRSELMPASVTSQETFCVELLAGLEKLLEGTRITPRATARAIMP